MFAFLLSAAICIDTGRQLFVDDYLIAGTSGVVRAWNAPVKHEGNPLIWPTTDLERENDPSIGERWAPCAVAMPGGLWWDPSRKAFRLWYEAGWMHSLVYAESRDGIRWRKHPDRLLKDIDLDTWTVFPDYAAENPYANWRLMISPECTQSNRLYRSEDGIDWRFISETGLSGDHSSMFYDPFRGHWTFSLRGGPDFRGRVRSIWTSDEFGGEKCRWEKPEMWIPSHFGGQVYAVDFVPYESLMLGMVRALKAEPGDNWTNMSNGMPKVTHLYYAFSRDGRTVEFPETGPAIACEGRGSGKWDSGYVSAIGGICAIKDERLWFFYSAMRGDASETRIIRSHGFWRRNGMHFNGAIGVATLRRDGFAAMVADGKGTVVTKPLVFSGSHLFVNADCRFGDMSVEVLDETGNVIDGFSSADCIPLSLEDSTKAEISWKGGSLASLAGKPVRFRFLLHTASLYSFWMSPSVRGESNGYVAAGGPDYPGLRDVRRVPKEAGTLMGRMAYRPGTEIARLKDSSGKTVLRVGFDRDKVFRAVFALADGKEAAVQRRPSVVDDLSADTFHFALAWGDGGSPRFFLNGLPFLTMFCPGDRSHVNIAGNLLGTARSVDAADFVQVYDRMLSNEEIVGDFRHFMPVDIVGRDVDQVASGGLRLAFTVAPEGTFTRPDPAPLRPRRPSAKVSFTAEVAGHPDTLTRFDDILVDRPLDLSLNGHTASLSPGAYRAVFRFSTGFSYTLRYNVMPPAPTLSAPSLDVWRRVKVVDEVAFDSPAAAPYTNCAVRIAESGAGRYLEADGKSGDRFSWIFNVPAALLGKPCLVDFVWPDDRSRVMGLYAYVSRHGMTCRDRLSNGLIAGGIFPNSGTAKTHSVLFWPASTNVLFEARTLVAGRPAALVSARMSLLGEPFPVLKVRRPEWTRGRTFGHCDEDQTFDVYMNRDFRGQGTEGILRDLIAYLRYTGQDLFQYGCGFRYRYGMSPHWGYREEGERHWPVNAGEYPYIARELAKAGISYSGIIYGGCVPEAEHDDFIGNVGEGKGWYLRNAAGEERPVMKMLNPGNAELVDLFYSHFMDLLEDCSRNGLSAVRFDINNGKVNIMDRFWSQLSFGAWEGSIWGRQTVDGRIDAVTRNIRRFRELLKEKAPGVEPRIGILMAPDMRLETLRSECGIDLERLAEIDGVRFAIRRQHTQYWFELFRGNDETDGQDFYYDANAPEWTALRKASGGAVTQVAAHNVYIETFEKSLVNDRFPCYFQNSDVKPNGRFFLKEPAFCVGTMDALNFAIGDQPLGSSGNEEEVREFVRAYEALPAMPFGDMKGDSPTVVGRSLDTDHGTYFYFVNMHHAGQRVELPEPVMAEDLSSGDASSVSAVDLKGFALRSFRAPKGVRLHSFAVARLEGAKSDDARRLRILLDARRLLADLGVDDPAGDALLARARAALGAYDLPEAHRLLHSVKANAIERLSAASGEVAEEAALHRRGVWRINCGNTSYSRVDGDLFSPDRRWDGQTWGWYGGMGLAIARDVTGMKPDERYGMLYATEKYRIEGYKVNLGAAGRYRVRVYAKAGWPRGFKANTWITDYTCQGKPLFPQVDFFRDQPDYWTPPKLEAVVDVGADGILDIGISSPVDVTIAFLNGLVVERLDGP